MKIILNSIYKSYIFVFVICQVRIGRFYKIYFLLLPLLQWAAPDLNCKLQIAVGSARPQRGAPDCSGQRGPQRGAPEWSGQRRTSSRADWAVPDLSYQKKNAQKYVRQECQKICQKRISEDILEMSEKDIRRYTRRNANRQIRKYIRKGY